MDKVKLVLGNRNYSSWSLRVWLCLRKCEVDFEEVVLPLDTPEFAQEISRHSPTRRVPVLWDGDLCVWDSLAICEYANERFAGGRLWPADMQGRALGRSMVAEMHSGYVHLRNNLPMNFRAVNRVVEIDAPTLADIDRVCALWSDSLERNGDRGPWLLGEFSIADAMFAPVAIRFGNYAVNLPEQVKPYIEQQLSDPDMRLWRDQAALETWIVEQDEAGTDPPAS